MKNSIPVQLLRIIVMTHSGNVDKWGTQPMQSLVLKKD